jgi:phosphoglycolate phosphatase
MWTTDVKYPTVLFDLDGTLIDSAPDLCAIANAILARDRLAPITLPEARSFGGHGVAAFVARMRAACGIANSEQDRWWPRFWPTRTAR